MASWCIAIHQVQTPRECKTHVANTTLVAIKIATNQMPGI
jgi:hypothetical protein